MFGVIMLHTMHDFMSSSGWNLASFLYKSAVVSIPLFFCVSGYLLFGREDIDYKYICRKIFLICKYVVIFCSLYWLIRGVTVEWIPLYRVIKNSLFARGQLFAFWYFSALCLVYLFLPILNKQYLKNYKSFLFIWIGCFLIQNIVFAYNVATHSLEINVVFRLYNWIGYFMLGGILKKERLRKVPYFVIILCIISNYLFQTVLVQRILFDYCSFFYSSTLVIFLVTVLFNNLVHEQIRRGKTLVRTLSKLFLIVFSIHPLLVDPVQTYVERYDVSLSFQAICCFMIVSILSIFLSWLILKIPYADRIFRV